MLCKRLRQWLCAKHKVDWKGDQTVSEALPHEVLGPRPPFQADE